MQGWREFLLNERVILCIMSIIFGGGILLLIKWDADREYVSIFGLALANFTGALLRGMTHNGAGIPEKNNVQDAPGGTISGKPL